MWRRYLLFDQPFSNRVALAASAILIEENVRRKQHAKLEKQREGEQVTVARGNDNESLVDCGNNWSSSSVPLTTCRNFAARPRPWSIMGQRVVQCDGITMVPHFSRGLRRHQTMVKMQKTATKDTVESKYEVQWSRPLGEGTFGAVYIGHERATSDRYAVKKIDKRYTDNDQFQREIEALLHLRDNGGHPHICGMRENFDEGDYYYLVIDFISGGEMFEHLCNHGAYSEADAARLIREVSSALAFMHGIGLVHGDMKPENLMLSSESTTDAVIKVVDFGCAHIMPNAALLPSASHSGTTNTPAYCPPEILKHKGRAAIEPSFDMWALGVIMYVMLTGVHPFDLYGNATDEEIEDIIVCGQKPPLHNSPLTAHLSTDAINVIEKLLQWDPKKRYTAEQLLEDPWVRGETANTTIIADSDKRLSAYRAFRTKLGAKVFADMVSWSTEDAVDTSGKEVTKRTSLLERAFQSLDPDHKGYVSVKDLQTITQDTGSLSGIVDEEVSLSGFSDLLAENMKNRYFPKGHVIYHEGDIGDTMYFLNSGAVEVYTKEGVTLAKLQKSGEFFGEGALMHPKKLRSASTRCLTPVHVIEISREYFEKYLAADLDVKSNLREKDKTRKRQRAKIMLSLQKNMQERTFQKGEYLFREGDKGEDLFILESGRIDVLIKDHSVMTVLPGSMCGEQSLVLGRARNVAAKCATDECRVHVLGEEDFYALLDSSPSLKESIRDTCLRHEFQKALCVATKQSSPKSEKELRRAFDIVVDTKKSKELDFDMIRRVLISFDPTYTQDEIWDIQKSLDLNDNGTVSWDEFKRIFGMENVDRTT